MHRTANSPKARILWYGMSNVLGPNLGNTISRYKENCAGTNASFVLWRILLWQDLTIWLHVHIRKIIPSEEIMTIHSFISRKYTLIHINAFFIHSSILHSSIYLFSHWFIDSFIKIVIFGSTEDLGYKNIGYRVQESSYLRENLLFGSILSKNSLDIW